MTINKWFFEFHLLGRGWLSTPPYHGDSPKSQAPRESLVTLRMIEFCSDDKAETLFRTEVAHVDSNRAKVAELINQHGLPKAILVNCWAQKNELEQQLATNN